jgi:hypothetical protein
MPDRTFTITEDHMKLLHSMYVDWDHTEFGAPAIDCKRPYGNSDVVADIAEILGHDAPDWESDDYDEQFDKYRRLHEEMQTVLQILVRNISDDYIGEYIKEPPYGMNWVRVKSEGTIVGRLGHACAINVDAEELERMYAEDDAHVHFPYAHDQHDRFYYD